jgi:hypothetical protein
MALSVRRLLTKPMLSQDLVSAPNASVFAQRCAQTD